jgi:hypothetical protein
MIHDTYGTGAKIKEFIGYLFVASWALLWLTRVAPLGIDVTANPFLIGIPSALFTFIGYAIIAGVLGMLLRIRKFGRFGEIAIGVVSGTITIWMLARCPLFHTARGVGMNVDSFAAAIAGGVIGTAFICALGTITGRLRWDSYSLWPLRIDRRDQRSFEATFTDPVVISLEHNGHRVFEQFLMGHVKIMLRDHAPYKGKTVMFIDGEPMGVWEC